MHTAIARETMLDPRFTDSRIGIHRALKPGGYIELTDHDLYPVCIDDTLKPDSPLLSFCDHMVAAGGKMGLDFLVPRDFKNILQDAGYENVTEVTKVCPLNTWPKDQRLKQIGLFQREQALDGLSGIGMGLFTRGLGWSPEEVELFNIEVSSTYHWYSTLIEAEDPWTK
ncbi:hypothetical protein GP486_001578 [Trichoglossum hirsutum]|uniref:Methyltransferase domain-containing protein n=1 Tax=Trichoglossum hirsutum TaxID=265104 RepID=A0A9P8LGF3_9PEZI|nr:hypothetical protein GP486_001578 [Trichoglossum hirsutum]